MFHVCLGSNWEVTALTCVGFNIQGMQTKILTDKQIRFSFFSDLSLTCNDGNSHDSAHPDQNFVFSQF